MSSNVITIATRNSALALWQANFIKSELEKRNPQLTVNILGIKTQGDKILDTPLAKIGGKGLFVKELELALLEKRADIAVHSMKDVPMDFPKGLEMPTICLREDPRDAFVSNQYETIDDLPEGAVVGTSSLRRQCQLTYYRPDLQIRNLRGNVNTRLQKLDNGEYDAIILAMSGLIRLEMLDRIKSALSKELSLPAVGQGALGIECRSDDEWVKELLKPLHHEKTADCVMAERAMNKRLEGGCQVPIAGFATLREGIIYMEGRVGSVDGKTLLKVTAERPQGESKALGIDIAEQLLGLGAGDILSEIYGHTPR